MNIRTDLPQKIYRKVEIEDVGGTKSGMSTDLELDVNCGMCTCTRLVWQALG